ncbi:PP2C family protein-serine/threonine phosphatase [Spirulina sp. 06S082]|uniref:PP2C family protein-serine/threonine phosphatase n=1 Tax=Spirulina sp. 06S082 TaxID=3110248 RepID=UPI002B204822|nr:protein phosphatase 2C domain-containing protein [Spirulina sp. 06S082]MEA5468247.1 protein phosphatase 2C domain-containing protein [Spirulina sp. 06S082]
MPRPQPQPHPYLWAVSPIASQLSPPNVIDGRYKIVAPQIWQDIYSERSPQLPNPIPDRCLPYLHLYPYRLHLPEIYGICSFNNSLILLLNNIPTDDRGLLYPTLEEAWPDASGLRQIYWLWQILHLWNPLGDRGVAASLLVEDNLRVEGWRLRLRELFTNSERLGNSQARSQGGIAVAKAATVVTLRQLGESWTSLARSAHSEIAPKLEAIAAELKRDAITYTTLGKTLNQLLLEQAARKPLRIQIASATDTGPQQLSNEDSYYPTAEELSRNGSQEPGSLISHLMLVCDGIGGHEGGEVASQLAIQSLKLQVRALLAESVEDPELMPPDLVEEQLTAIVRIANNLICFRNDEQKRESRRRMATTLVMAIQLPQQVANLASGVGNSHELYLVHVGDSRAYWITENYCQLLTVDDDVTTREIRLARSLPITAAQRPDAGALTQALGTREADRLRPTIQRFIIEEDGILLLCSDGLSDNQLLEEYWAEFAPNVLAGRQSLENAIEYLIKLANQKNGHDNTSIVAALYSVSAQYSELVNPDKFPSPSQEIPSEFESQLPLEPSNGNGWVGADLPLKMPAMERDFDREASPLEVEIEEKTEVWGEEKVRYSTPSIDPEDLPEAVKVASENEIGSLFEDVDLEEGLISEEEGEISALRGQQTWVWVVGIFVLLSLVGAIAFVLKGRLDRGQNIFPSWPIPTEETEE